MNKGERKNGAAFYIALCCCVAVIGLVGYVGRYASKKTEPPEPVSDVAAEIVPENTPIMLMPTPPSQKPLPSDAPSKKTEKAVQTVASVSTEQAVKTPEPIRFEAPCVGKVIKKSSADELEYNAVLGDWRAHSGVDIGATAGSEIKAVHSGTVMEVFAGALGETIIIDCQNGFTAVYGCLAENDAISVGQTISAGEVIGAVGGTGSENVTEPHLHLELIKDGSCVNPEDYIKFSE